MAYIKSLDKIKETPFDYEIKNQCEKLLEYCKIGKYNALKTNLRKESR